MDKKNDKPKKKHIKPMTEVYSIEPRVILANSYGQTDIGGEGYYFD